MGSGGNALPQILSCRCLGRAALLPNHRGAARRPPPSSLLGRGILGCRSAGTAARAAGTPLRQAVCREEPRGRETRERGGKRAEKGPEKGGERARAEQPRPPVAREGERPGPGGVRRLCHGSIARQSPAKGPDERTRPPARAAADWCTGGPICPPSPLMMLARGGAGRYRWVPCRLRDPEAFSIGRESTSVPNVAAPRRRATAGQAPAGETGKRREAAGPREWPGVRLRGGARNVEGVPDNSSRLPNTPRVHRNAPVGKHRARAPPAKQHSKVLRHTPGPGEGDTRGTSGTQREGGPCPCARAGNEDAPAAAVCEAPSPAANRAALGTQGPQRRAADSKSPLPGWHTARPPSRPALLAISAGEGFAAPPPSALAPRASPGPCLRE